MFNEDHYNECSTIFNQLIEKQTSLYRKVVESKKSSTKHDNIEYVVYTNGLIPQAIGKG